MISEEEDRARLVENSRLRKEGWPAGTIPHPELTHRTLQNLFLPVFNAAGSCILWRRAPEEVADSWPGFTTTPHELGWEIRSKADHTGSFPFWNLSPLSPSGWMLFVGCNYDAHRAVLEEMLSHTYNPNVVSNPRASSVYRQLAKKARLRGGRFG